MPVPRHILEVRQFDRSFVLELFERAESMRSLAGPGFSARLQGKLMATLFFEPSTRTRLSFEAAMTRLGGGVISAEYAGATSSAVKGETIEDTARIVAGYADLLVIRHPEAGAAARAAAVVDVPVINAGDGPNEHPTQALLDLYTIWKELGRIDGLRIALVGDLRYGRAARSLAMLLTQTRDTELFLVAPPTARMSQELRLALSGAGVRVTELDDLEGLAPSLDVIYQTRIQRERFTDLADYEAARGRYIIDQSLMRRFNPQGIVLHPLPRVDEIHPSVDDDPRAAYFRQARHGLYLRMALLDWVLGEQPVVVTAYSSGTAAPAGGDSAS
ncbi:aspartate carbamoyltransferase [Thermomicrobiaceae bacterium CFH 74404]|uniref:Aspartate carbamoyltransferase n=1 Tax=Thermalbibacter longus TaxID=2951981 RepID=A0AA42B9P3_9BACT|nr:aspartate carbamoyltransferase [Thermalbibacter longus]MCM8748652.1 aspartate carbamoyltransferase [Thermalbibacter longus]